MVLFFKMKLKDVISIYDLKRFILIYIINFDN